MNEREGLPRLIGNLHLIKSIFFSCLMNYTRTHFHKFTISFGVLFHHHQQQQPTTPCTTIKTDKKVIKLWYPFFLSVTRSTSNQWIHRPGRIVIHDWKLFSFIHLIYMLFPLTCYPRSCTRTTRAKPPERAEVAFSKMGKRRRTVPTFSRSTKFHSQRIFRCGKDVGVFTRNAMLWICRHILIVIPCGVMFQSGFGCFVFVWWIWGCDNYLSIDGHFR